MGKYNKMPRNKNYVKKAKDAGAIDIAQLIKKTTSDVIEQYEDGDFVLGEDGDVSVISASKPIDADEIIDVLFDPNSDVDDIVDITPQAITSDWFMDRYQDLLDRVTTGENSAEIVYDLALRFASFFDGDIHAFEFASAAFGRKLEDFNIPCHLDESVQYEGKNIPLFTPRGIYLFRPK